MNSLQSKPSHGKQALGYLALVGATIASFVLVRTYLLPPETAGQDLQAVVKEHPRDAFAGLLIAIAAIVIVSQLFGALIQKIGQPAVIGEVIAGIALGPSLLGKFAPGATRWLFPPDVIPLIGLVAQVGIIGYMFLVGLELDTKALRRRADVAVTVSHASILVPFALGTVLSAWLYPRYSLSSVSPTVFALFVGVSMSVTAFPVLARILTEHGLTGTKIGTIALACAAVDDVTAWCLLAFVVSIATAESGYIVATLGLTALYIVSMIVVARPLVIRFADAYETSRIAKTTAFTVVCIALLLSALSTKAIGIHALFGAFALGAITPHDSGLAKDLKLKLESVVVTFMLPAFFAFTGLRTQIALVDTWEAFAALGLVVLVASAGKLGGSAVAARLNGVAWREACGLGVLMNTRGLMELIVLNVGLDLGILSPTLFAILVLMAVITTFATPPLLRALRIDANATGALNTLAPPPIQS